jgi:hypothetical protein
VDAGLRALHRIVAGDVLGDYRPERDGSFHPAGYVEPMLFDLG